MEAPLYAADLHCAPDLCRGCREVVDRALRLEARWRDEMGDAVASIRASGPELSDEQLDAIGEERRRMRRERLCAKSWGGVAPIGVDHE